jgi:hypothetical protein
VRIVAALDEALADHPEARERVSSRLKVLEAGGAETG